MTKFKVIAYRTPTIEFQFTVEANDVDEAWAEAEIELAEMENSYGDLMYTGEEIVYMEQIED